MTCSTAIPARLEALHQFSKVHRPINHSDRLEHFDGDNSVVATVNVTVILQANIGAIEQAAGLETRTRKLELPLRQRECGHVTAMPFNQVLDQSAPAATDLQYPFVAVQFQEFAHASKLVVLGCFEFCSVEEYNAEE